MRGARGRLFRQASTWQRIGEKCQVMWLVEAKSASEACVVG